MATTDPTTGFVFHEDTDVIAPIADYVNEVVTPINDYVKGTLGVWQDYTPTLEGITRVNGTVTGRYTKIGRLVRFEATYVAGSSDTFSGTFTITFPVARRSGYINGQPWGEAFLQDASVGTSTRRAGTIVHNTSTRVIILVDSLSTNTLVTDSVPWTWATGDVIYVAGTYEASS